MEDGSQARVTRQQFRGKNGLLLIFTADAAPAIVARLTDIGQAADHYKKLNVRVFVIVPSAAVADTLPALPFPVLIDADGQAWSAYSTIEPQGAASDTADYHYGMFLLDRYGGVDSELITDQADALPDAQTALDWARYAMYKCVC